MARFEEQGAQVLGASCDGRLSHAAFAEHMGGISFPILTDFHPHGEVAQLFGVYNPERGTAIRSVFLIDEEGYLRWVKVYTRGLPENEELLTELAKL